MLSDEGLTLTLTINQTSFEDAGVYRCNVSTPLQEVTALITLEVRGMYMHVIQAGNNSGLNVTRNFKLYMYLQMNWFWWHLLTMWTSRAVQMPHLPALSTEMTP